MAGRLQGLPRPVADRVWVVDGAPISLGGVHVPVRMTVLGLADGGLLLHSPVTHTLALEAALQQLGEIRHLVAPNVAHWTMLQGWQTACPLATTWAVPNLRLRGQVRNSGLRIDSDLAMTPPPEWRDDIDQTIIPGGLGFQEVAMFHRGSRTLVLVDVVQNMARGAVPPLLRPLAGLLGIATGDGRPPVYVRAIVRAAGAPARVAAARLLAWQPERVIFSHGRWFEEDGTAALARSLQWLLPARG